MAKKSNKKASNKSEIVRSEYFKFEKITLFGFIDSMSIVFAISFLFSVLDIFIFHQDTADPTWKLNISVSLIAAIIAAIKNKKFTKYGQFSIITLAIALLVWWAKIYL